MRRPARLDHGFTLVEILVTITIIAILAGLLVVGVFPVLTRGKEIAIKTQLVELERAIEEFKTKYGMYPPSFVGIRHPDPQVAATQLLTYLNRMVPSNRESEFVSPGMRRIDLWWEGVGQYIDHQSGEDLVFWLSGLGKNKAFPLTNGVEVASNMPWAFDSDVDGVEKDVFFNFKNKQLLTQDQRVGANGNNFKVACYNQTSQEFAPFRYIDRNHYANFLQLGNRDFTGYWYWADGRQTQDLPNQTQIESGVVRFENPKTFQLVAPGVSNTMGQSGNPIMGGNLIGYSLQDADTLTNFSENRLGNHADELREQLGGL